MGKKGMGKLLAGLGIGTLIGMAVSPKSGEENRKAMKKKAKQVVNKVKEVDLDEMKDNLERDFQKFKSELEGMTPEKAKKLAKEKGSQLMEKCEDLIEKAKKKGKPVVEKTAKDMKKKLSEVLKDLSEKLDN